MIKYSVIIPNFNRTKNLECVLMSLVMQTYPVKFWEVLISDESNVIPWQTINAYQDVLNLTFLWRKHSTGNPGLARNFAAQNARGEALIFLDSDVILNNQALEWYDRLHTKWPEAIICGRYDWLKPMNVTPEDIVNRFDKVVSNQLPQTEPISPGPLLGVDPRFQDKRTKKWNKPSSLSPVTRKPYALGMFGGNLLIPKDLFLKSGGFDPNIKGHGGEDCELGWKMQSMGAKALFTEKTIGWHIWHPRDQGANEESVKKNIKYIEEKYRDLHIKYGIIAAPEKNIIYNDDGTFVPPETQKSLGISK